MKKLKVVYSESYKNPGLHIRRDLNPTLPSATGFSVSDAFILKAGVMEIEGERLEFQDIRIYLKEGR